MPAQNNQQAPGRGSGARESVVSAAQLVDETSSTNHGRNSGARGRDERPRAIEPQTLEPAPGPSRNAQDNVDFWSNIPNPYTDPRAFDNIGISTDYQLDGEEDILSGLDTMVGIGDPVVENTGVFPGNASASRPGEADLAVASAAAAEPAPQYHYAQRHP